MADLSIQNGNRSLSRVKVITQDDNKVVCTSALGSAKSTLELGEALNGLVVSLKEGKNHITYSIDKVEEMALYQFLKERNESGKN